MNHYWKNIHSKLADSLTSLFINHLLNIISQLMFLFHYIIWAVMILVIKKNPHYQKINFEAHKKLNFASHTRSSLAIFSIHRKHELIYHMREEWWVNQSIRQTSLDALWIINEGKKTNWNVNLISESKKRNKKLSWISNDHCENWICAFISSESRRDIIKNFMNEEFSQFDTLRMPVYWKWLMESHRANE